MRIGIALSKAIFTKLFGFRALMAPMREVTMLESVSSCACDGDDTSESVRFRERLPKFMVALLRPSMSSVNSHSKSSLVNS